MDELEPLTDEELANDMKTSFSSVAGTDLVLFYRLRMEGEA